MFLCCVMLPKEQEKAVHKLRPTKQHFPGEVLSPAMLPFLWSLDFIWVLIISVHQLVQQGLL